jgi:endo-1,4-beta-xylanase
MVNVSNPGDPYIRQYRRSESYGQHWLQRRHAEDDSAKFINRATGLVIDAIGGTLLEHTQLQQYVDTGNPNQRWYGDWAQGNSFSMYASNRTVVWDVPYSSTAEGDIIQLSAPTDADNQAWLFDPVVVEPTFKIVSRESRLVLDVPGFSTADGTPIQQYEDNGGFNQAWQMQDAGNGLFKIIFRLQR